MEKLKKFLIYGGLIILGRDISQARYNYYSWLVQSQKRSDALRKSQEEFDVVQVEQEEEEERTSTIYRALKKYARRGNNRGMQALVNILQPGGVLYSILVGEHTRGETAPLILATKHQHWDVANTLIAPLSPTQKFTVLRQQDSHQRTAVMHACKFGNVETIQNFLEDLHPTDLRTLLALTDKHGDTALGFIARSGHVEAANAYLETLSDDDKILLLQQQNEYGLSALMLSISVNNILVAHATDLFGNMSEEQKLLQLKNNYYRWKWIVGENEIPPSYPKTVELILNSVPEENRYKLLCQEDSIGNNPLTLAVWRGRPDIVKIIRDKVSPEHFYELLCHPDRNDRTTPLMLASIMIADPIWWCDEEEAKQTRDKRRATIKLLLENLSVTQKITLLEQRDIQLDTALIKTASCGDADTIALLLGGMEPSHKTHLLQYVNNPALTAAACSGNAAAVQELLRGISVPDRMNLLKRHLFGLTPFEAAALSGQAETFTALLEGLGLDQKIALCAADGGDKTNYNTASLLLLAANDNDVLEWVLEQIQLDIDSLEQYRFKNGDTVLICAIRNNREQEAKRILQVILKKAKNPNALLQQAGECNCTALIWAVYHNNLEIVHALLDAASDKDALLQKKDKNEVTALMVAAENNNLDIVQMLLDAITDKATRQRLIEESLKYAKNDEMITLLQSYSA